MFDVVRFQYSQVFVSFLFSVCSIFVFIVSSIISVMCRFRILIICKFNVKFHFYVLTVYSQSLYEGFQFLFLLANTLMPSKYIRWLIFSGNLVRLYPPAYFLSMWLIGIIATTNSNGDSASSWDVLLIFICAKLLAPAIYPAFQFSLVLSINCVISSDILYILRQSNIQLCWTKLLAVLLLNRALARFFRLILLLLRLCGTLILLLLRLCGNSPISLDHLWHLFWTSGNSLRLIKE